ncbi:uncharacterized protein APUU_21814A [Aspergillus puulaauensis]|uniref:Uncharacterized protein n=1 Tax=Aspergillus puulaauensis TaxID=1220207 RepID=A0A7R7XH04_9EURO|nr:uncharacterized protein APUU_21814A [Aspergillus puulaauensis]BCS21382.1 hypothetical protein APUU_21814A [Aspergillus puulaauensis]
MVLHLTFVILAEINTAGIRKVLHIAMGSGDKPPSRLLGPKSGAIRGKAVVEQSVVSENESELQESIMDCDWSQLESTYIRMMDRHERSEEELRDHITKLLQVPYNEYSTYPPGFDMTLQVFTAWSQTTVEHDETRALKRFRTQMHHVQNSEETLEKKRKHYLDVVKAFESALALLNDRVKP